MAKGIKLISRKAVATGLLVALLLQMTAMFCSAALAASGPISGGSSGGGGIVNGVGRLESDELIAQLKKDFLGTVNKDLISRIEDQQLKGETQVIITFSDDSMVDAYSDSSKSDRMTFTEYCRTSAASRIEKRMVANQSKVLSALEEAGLIDGVKHRYTNIMDAAFVSTTYEQLEQICDFEGVERVVLSDTYEAVAAVENPVDVYDTGIFNSGNVD